MANTKVCPICGVEFSKPYPTSMKVWNTISKYCSSACRVESTRGCVPHNKAQVTLICETCGDGFAVSPSRVGVARFCSRQCSGVFKRTLVGPKATHWQGGLTAEGVAIRNSIEYKQWREAVFIRDDYTCQTCGARGVQIEADHIKLFSRHPELRFDVSNGQTLCKPCHREKTTMDLKTNWVNQYSRAN